LCFTFLDTTQITYLGPPKNHYQILDNKMWTTSNTGTKKQYGLQDIQRNARYSTSTFYPNLKTEELC